MENKMPEKDNQTHPWLMERRYFSLIIVLVFIILSATAFYICYRHHTINTEQILKEDTSAANLLSLVLNEHLLKIVSVMESYSNRPLLLQAVRDKNVKNASVHLINLTKSNPDIDSVIITDRQGTLWAAYPERPEVSGKNFAYRDWYKDISKEWKANVSDVYLRVVAEKDLAISIAVPFFNETGEAIGILLNTQRTISLNNHVKQVPLDPGASISVADRKGHIIYSSRYDYEKEIRPYPFHADMKKAMAAKTNAFAVDDPNLGGRRRYISFAQVSNIGWTVFVGRDKRSILLSELAYYLQVTAISFLLFLSFTVFLFYSRKKVMNQQLQESLRAEEALRENEGQFRHMFHGHEAIMLLIDSETGAIRDANAAAAQFYGYSTERLCQMAIQDINILNAEEVAHQRTLAFQAKRNYFIFPHRLAGGEIKTVEVHTSPITIQDKTFLFSIVHDISERKRAEEALRQQTEDFRASNAELELFNLAATGRELRMIELKQEINELCRRLGEPPRHAMDALETDSVPGAGPAPPVGGGA